MMSKIVIALALIALVRGQAVDYPPGNPNYSFDYHVNDPTTGDQKSQTETRQGDAVQGSYSLVEPDGTTRTVEYTADDAQGFVAHVTKSAGAVAPVPVAPVYRPPVAYHAPIYHAPVAYHAPVYHAPYAAPYAYHAPLAYHAPVYHAPVYHAPVYGPAVGVHPPAVPYYKK